MYIPICLPLFLIDLISATLTLKSVILISPMLLAFLLSSTCSVQSKTAPVSLHKISPLNIVPFFRYRFDFLNWGFRTTGQSIFKFDLFNKTVVAVSGESARKAFLTTKAFDLHTAFKDLLGGIPIIKGVTSDLHGKTIAVIYRRLATVQNQERLTRLIPLLLNDCSVVMESWGKCGTLDPFPTIYELVFQLTVRALASCEIADDADKVRRLKRLYDMVDEGNTPASILFPWFPSWGMLKKLFATWRIYSIIHNAREARVNSGKHKEDAMQMLLDSGDGDRIVAGFTMGLLIAGARSTGTTASWLVTFMGAHPEWKDKVRAELESLLLSDCSSPIGEQTSLSSLSASLSRIPLDVWESSTPLLDKMIIETLRLAQPHTAMRKNVGPDMLMDGKVIPSGAYIVYPFSDVHLNAELYPNPWKFDPTRPHDRRQFSWIGFGGGKNICLGQRLARLEMKLLAAMFVLGFNYAIVDAHGRVPDPLPRPNWNDILGCRPPKGTCMLDYQLL